MIEAAVIAIAGFFLWIAATLRGNSNAKKELQMKENKDEAEKIVKSKTAGELVDDFNKRYPVEGGDKR